MISQKPQNFNIITSPVVSQREFAVPPSSPIDSLTYKVVEHRRTVYVTSTVPLSNDSQWRRDVDDILKMSGQQASGRDGKGNFRRTSSAPPDHIIVEEVTRSTAPRESSSGQCRPRSSFLRTPISPIRSRHNSPVRQKILFYHKDDPHYGFTNFSPHPVVYKGLKYPTSEHLFQSFKFQGHRPNLAEHIRLCSSRPAVALSEARRFQPEARRDWFKVNIQMMDETLWHKFNQHLDLKAELLATGDAELIEDSDKDSFWGVGADKRGRNELGKALERLRDKLREAA